MRIYSIQFKSEFYRIGWNLLETDMETNETVEIEAYTEADKDKALDRAKFLNKYERISEDDK